MKTIILAAGLGKRLKPHTDQIPKCMVKFKDKEIIDYIIQVNNNCGVKKLVIVKGYKQWKLKKSNVLYYKNNDFDSTNMVETLMCAKNEFDGLNDIIISYSYSGKTRTNIISDHFFIASSNICLSSFVKKLS